MVLVLYRKMLNISIQHNLFLYVSITFKRFAKLSLIFNTSNYDVNTNNCSTSRLVF